MLPAKRPPLCDRDGPVRDSGCPSRHSFASPARYSIRTVAFLLASPSKKAYTLAAWKFGTTWTSVGRTFSSAATDSAKTCTSTEANMACRIRSSPCRAPPSIIQST